MKRLTYLSTLIILAGIQTGCSPGWHLQQAERKGAKITVDTVFKQVITESKVTDTVLRFQQVDRILAGEPIIIENEKVRTVTRIDTATKTVYQFVECKADTVLVPVAVTRTIQAGYTKWQLGGSLVALAVLLLG